MSIAFALIVSLRSCRCLGGAEWGFCVPRTGDHATTFDEWCELTNHVLSHASLLFAQVYGVSACPKLISDCDIVPVVCVCVFNIVVWNNIWTEPARQTAVLLPRSRLVLGSNRRSPIPVERSAAHTLDRR